MSICDTMRERLRNIGDELGLHLHPLPTQGQALAFPLDRLRGVCIKMNRACSSCAITPILTFPLDGGRDIRLRIPVRGEGALSEGTSVRINTRMR